jgi:hypothetical protein
VLHKRIGEVIPNDLLFKWYDVSLLLPQWDPCFVVQEPEMKVDTDAKSRSLDLFMLFEIVLDDVVFPNAQYFAEEVFV